jgi:hypothetical protein
MRIAKFTHVAIRLECDLKEENCMILGKLLTNV